MKNTIKTVTLAVIALITFSFTTIETEKKEIKTDIQEGLDFAFKEEPIAYEEKSFIEDVYSPFNFKAVKSGVNTSYIRFIDAVQEGLKAVSYTHLTLPTTPYV